MQCYNTWYVAGYTCVPIKNQRESLSLSLCLLYHAPPRPPAVSISPEGLEKWHGQVAGRESPSRTLRGERVLEKHLSQLPVARGLPRLRCSGRAHSVNVAVHPLPLRCCLGDLDVLGGSGVERGSAGIFALGLRLHHGREVRRFWAGQGGG